MWTRSSVRSPAERVAKALALPLAAIGGVALLVAIGLGSAPSGSPPAASATDAAAVAIPLTMLWVFIVDADGTGRAKYQGVMGTDDIDVIVSMLTNR